MLAEILSIASSIVGILASIAGVVFAVRATKGIKAGEVETQRRVAHAQALGAETDGKTADTESKWKLIVEYVADYGHVRSSEGKLLGLAILALWFGSIALSLSIFQHWTAFL